MAPVGRASAGPPEDEGLPRGQRGIGREITLALAQKGARVASLLPHQPEGGAGEVSFPVLGQHILFQVYTADASWGRDFRRSANEPESPETVELARPISADGRTPRAACELEEASPLNVCGIRVLVCDASYKAAAEGATDLAEEVATLAGWLNNAAVSRIPLH